MPMITSVSVASDSKSDEESLLSSIRHETALRRPGTASSTSVSGSDLIPSPVTASSPTRPCSKTIFSFRALPKRFQCRIRDVQIAGALSPTGNGPSLR